MSNLDKFKQKQMAKLLKQKKDLVKLVVDATKKQYEEAATQKSKS